MKNIRHTRSSMGRSPSAAPTQSNLHPGLASRPIGLGGARASFSTEKACRLALIMATLLYSVTAQAQAMGQGLITYVTPIILWLGVAAVVAALVSAAIKPEFVMRAVWIAIILVVIFFILRNTASLQSAVQ